MKRYAYNSAELERLSNELLDEALRKQDEALLEQVSARDIAMMGGKLSAKGLAEVGGEAAAEQLRQMEDKINDAHSRLLGRRLQRGRIVRAIENGDINAASALAGSNLELHKFVARVAVQKRRPGEQKNRPRDHSPMDRQVLEIWWDQINLLREIWKKREIKVDTSDLNPQGPKGAALYIVLRRVIPRAAGSAPDYVDQRRGDLKKELIAFDKNRAHRGRRR
jgi:hypothetical protein